MTWVGEVLRAQGVRAWGEFVPAQGDLEEGLAMGLPFDSGKVESKHARFHRFMRASEKSVKPLGLCSSGYMMGLREQFGLKRQWSDDFHYPRTLGRRTRKVEMAMGQTLQEPQKVLGRAMSSHNMFVHEGREGIEACGHRPEGGHGPGDGHRPDMRQYRDLDEEDRENLAARTQEFTELRLAELGKPLPCKAVLPIHSDTPRPRINDQSQTLNLGRKMVSRSVRRHRLAYNIAMDKASLVWQGPEAVGCWDSYLQPGQPQCMQKCPLTSEKFDEYAHSAFLAEPSGHRPGRAPQTHVCAEKFGGLCTQDPFTQKVQYAVHHLIAWIKEGRHSAHIGSVLTLPSGSMAWISRVTHKPYRYISLLMASSEGGVHKVGLVDGCIVEQSAHKFFHAWVSCPEAAGEPEHIALTLQHYVDRKPFPEGPQRLEDTLSAQPAQHCLLPCTPLPKEHRAPRPRLPFGIAHPKRMAKRQRISQAMGHLPEHARAVSDSSSQPGTSGADSNGADSNELMTETDQESSTDSTTSSSSSAPSSAAGAPLPSAGPKHIGPREKTTSVAPKAGKKANCMICGRPIAVGELRIHWWSELGSSVRLLKWIHLSADCFLAAVRQQLERGNADPKRMAIAELRRFLAQDPAPPENQRLEVAAVLDQMLAL
jgi:hypothetical protein